MRNFKKYIIILTLIAGFLFIMYKGFKITYKKELSGNIEILSNKENYNYLKNSAEHFMNINKKIRVSVREYSDYELLGYLNKTTKLDEEPDFITLNSKLLRGLDNDALERINYTNNIIVNYNKNFDSWRLNEIKNGKNYLAIPIQSDPQFLMVREDLLKKYGYKSEDIRTWNELIDLCKSIINESDKEVNLFSYDFTNIEDIRKIISYQGASTSQRKELMDNIKSDNLIGKGIPLCYIANKDNFEWIINNNSEDSLKAIMIPSIVLGGNRAIAFDSENIVWMRSSHEEEIASMFLTFLIDNQSLINETFIMDEGFFPSSKAFYNNMLIDTEFDRINNQKLLSIMENITSRVPDTIDYYELDNELDYEN